MIKWFLLFYFWASAGWAAKNSDAQLISAISKAKSSLEKNDIKEAQKFLNEADVIPTRSFKIRWQFLETQILALYLSKNYSRAEQILGQALPKPSNPSELSQAFSSLALMQATLLDGNYFVPGRILLSQFRGWYTELKSKIKGSEFECRLETATLTQALFEKQPSPEPKSGVCNGSAEMKSYFEYLHAAKWCDRFKMAEAKAEFLPVPEELDFRHSFVISIENKCN